MKPQKQKRGTVRDRSGYSRRYTTEQRSHALDLLSQGKSRSDVAKIIGATPNTIRNWSKLGGESDSKDRHETAVALSGPASAVEEKPPKEGQGALEKPGSPSVYRVEALPEGISEKERAAILWWKKQHPSMGAAQIRAQLFRAKKWSISVRVITRVLKAEGYDLVHRGSRPKDVEYERFEAPRPGAMWQMDFGVFRVSGEKVNLLVALDDFSRFVVGHGFYGEQSSEAACDLLERAMSRYGRPESIRTDRGSGFLARSHAEDFSRRLEAYGIDHIVGRAYHPQGGGKVESLIGTVRRELWNVEHFDSLEHAQERTLAFFDFYNEHRAHLGIDGLTPADRFFGRGDKVRAELLAVTRRRSNVLLTTALAGQPTEEDLGPEVSEVLRLMIVGDRMELRFCGARLSLGKINR